MDFAKLSLVDISKQSSALASLAELLSGLAAELWRKKYFSRSKRLSEISALGRHF